MEDERFSVDQLKDALGMSSWISAEDTWAGIHDAIENQTPEHVVNGLRKLAEIIEKAI